MPFPSPKKLKESTPAVDSRGARWLCRAVPKRRAKPPFPSLRDMAAELGITAGTNQETENYESN
jgi:hypothetical protein